MDDSRLWGEARRTALPATFDGVPVPLRASRRGELVVDSLAGGGRQVLSDEGSYFVATNPTPGTGITGIAAADGLDDLETLLFIRNTEAAGGKRIYLDYLRLQVTAAGTNGTNYAVAMKLDRGNSRWASGGSLITPQCPNIDAANASVAQIRFGALVTTAATTDARLVAARLLRPVIKVVGDTYLFHFGQQASVGSLAPAGTAITALSVTAPPIVIGPGQTFFLHEFAASQTVAAGYEFELGYWER